MNPARLVAGDASERAAFGGDRGVAGVLQGSCHRRSSRIVGWYRADDRNGFDGTDAAGVIVVDDGKVGRVEDPYVTVVPVTEAHGDAPGRDWDDEWSEGRVRNGLVLPRRGG